MVWQSRERVEWATALHEALAPGTAIPEDGANPYSLGDPAVTTALLNSAGFAEIDFAEVREPVFYGADVDTAFDALLGLQIVKVPLPQADADAALKRLRKLLEAHLTPEGVLFDSRAWIVTARYAHGKAGPRS